MRREGLGVFPGKNQSCSPCRETHRTGGDYADYDAIHIYSHPLDEALGRERTSTSALWAGGHPVGTRKGSRQAAGAPPSNAGDAIDPVQNLYQKVRRRPTHGAPCDADFSLVNGDFLI